MQLKHKCFTFFRQLTFILQILKEHFNFKIGSQEFLSKHAFFKILGESTAVKSQTGLILRPSLCD